MNKDEFIRRLYTRTNGLYTQKELSTLLIDIFEEIGHIVLTEERSVRLRGIGKFKLLRTRLNKAHPINKHGVQKRGKKVVFNPGTLFRRVYNGTDERSQRDYADDVAASAIDQNGD